MIKDVINQSEQRMQKSIATLKAELAKLRTGRAHPSLLEHITVNYYGNDVPLSQVANINVLDARTLSISPWEKNMIPVIEKAILTSDLGLNPSTSGQLIRVPMPPLNEERRRELTKVVRQEGENAKVAVRNIRREANNEFKDALKEKLISEDDERRGQDSIQKLTDKYIAEIDEIIAHKEADLMTV